jgi:hypothetical protein
VDSGLHRRFYNNKDAPGPKVLQGNSSDLRSLSIPICRERGGQPSYPLGTLGSACHLFPWTWRSTVRFLPFVRHEK